MRMQIFLNCIVRGISAKTVSLLHHVQYPGVAQSIDSDIDNLMGILKLWSILPEGASACKYMYMYMQMVSQQLQPATRVQASTHTAISTSGCYCIMH